MQLTTTTLKDVFKINIKQRTDTYTDQYHRIFMVKLFLACTIVMGINWYKDTINCIVPKDQSSGGKFEKFVSKSCWINGLYVYKELRDYPDKMAYYGIPHDLDNDDFFVPQSKKSDKKYLCRSKLKLNPGIHQAGVCKPFKRTFYLQYQWMPFFICALALVYYIPYMIQRTVNHDLINLSKEIQKENVNTKNIAKFYFKDRKNKNKSNMLTIRQIVNLWVKLLYVAVNVIALLGINSVLLGEFHDYGKKWISWSKHNNSISFDYMGARSFPKPGNELLPPFGYCEVFASSKDVKATYVNVHKFVCEISQHILYQYAFIVLWFAIIVGIVVSVIGVVMLSIHFIFGIGIRYRKNHAFKTVSRYLTYREMEYLDFLRHKDIPVYGEVLEELKARIDRNELLEKAERSPRQSPEQVPLYPRKRRSSIEKANGSPYKF